MKLRKWFLGAALMAAMCLGLAGTAVADETEQTVVYAGTAEELKEALKSNVKIVLEGKDYLITDEYGPSTLWITGLENVTIQGTEGTRIMTEASWDQVISISNCKNIVLDNITFGHDIPTGKSCTGGVIEGNYSDITIMNCDIFGCGLVGISVGNGTFDIQNSIIHDCSESIIELGSGTATFDKCVFSGNGYKDPSAYGVNLFASDADASCKFVDCTFTDNRNPYFIGKWEDQGFHADYTCDNCTFSGNYWDDYVGIQSISIEPENVTLKLGESYELPVTVIPENATNQSVRWAVNDAELEIFNAPGWEHLKHDSAILMDEPGVVTAVKEGTAEVYCWAADGSNNQSKVCTITVVKADPVTPPTEQDQTVVYASTVEELDEALKSNTKIVLEGKDYTYERCLILEDLENVTIQGVEGTRITSLSAGSDVIDVRNSQNIMLDGIVFGHDIPTLEACDDPGVVGGYNSEITILGCDMFGCGTRGLYISGCKVTMRDSVIHDCTRAIMRVEDSIADFDNCTFSNNGYEYPEPYGVYISAYEADSSCEFSSCVFENNKNIKFVRRKEKEGVNASYTCDNCEFSGNVWEDNDDILVESITISPEELTLKVGESFQLSVDIFPKDATDQSLKWETEYVNDDIATVDEQGIVTALREGHTYIWCLAQDGSYEMSSCRVNVEKADPNTPTPPDIPQDPEVPDTPAEGQIQAITITPSELSLKVGEKKTLSYTSTPSNAERASVTWHSTDSKVASVNQEGTVTGLRKGTAEIYCVSQDGGNVESNHCIVNVTASSNNGISGGGSGGSGGSGSSSSGSGRRGSSGARAGSGSLPSYVIRGTWAQAEDGTWRFTDSSGNLYANTWAAVENQYANEAAGQQKFDWFRFDENGKMITGWYYDNTDGHWYYLNPVSDGTLGKMMTGWVIIDGSYYYFNPNSDGSRGRLYMNETTPDGYQVDGDGKWIR